MGVFSSKVAQEPEVFVEAPLAPKEDVVWHDCMEQKPRTKHTSQLVADRLSWVQEQLLSPSNTALTTTTTRETQRRKSELVAERKKLLEECRRKEEQRSWTTQASKELVAERLRFLEEQINSKEETTAIGITEQQQQQYQARSSELVAERARLLEEWSAQTKSSSPKSIVTATTSTDLVEERKRLLEEQRQHKPTKQPQDTFITNDLVTERARWLQERQTVQKKDEDRLAVPVSSDLVTERARWLEERRLKVDTQPPSSSRIESSLLEGVASERSKWYQLWSSGGKKNTETEPSPKKSTPGKLDPTRLIPTSSSSTTAATTRQSTSKDAEAAVFGSLAEKRARFLVEENTKDDDDTTPSAARGRPQQRWGENYMPHVEQMVEETGFIGHVLVEVEQEGLLPNFLAERTAWLFGGGRAPHDDSEPKPDVINLLRLDCYDDHQPPSMEQPDGSNQHEQCANAESFEDEDSDIFLDPMPTVSLTDEASTETEAQEFASPAKTEDVDTGIVTAEATDQELFLDKADTKPWSELSYDESKTKRKEMLCSFCAIM